MTFATDQPGHRREGARPPQVRLRRRCSTRGSTLDPPVFELLHEAGEAEGIPFTVDRRRRARTGTDADAFHISRAGIPTGVVSVPLRYMHSPVEMVQLDDVENAREADRGLRAARLGRATPDFQR